MKWTIFPYVVVFVISVLVAIVRFILIPQWSPNQHFFGLIIQWGALSLCWLIVRTINIYLNKVIPAEKNMRKRIVAGIALSFLIIGPVYTWFLLNINMLIIGEFVNKQFLAIVSLLFCALIILMNLGYNALYFFQQWQKSVVEKADLQVLAASIAREKSMMQYHHLKNQVNPHFLFNAFTSLDGLIKTQPDLASDFIRHLSKVYRYVLEHKENEVVSLQTEVDFIQHYISLLAIRYKDRLKIQMTISETALDRGIVMVTLQMLIDNAIKHNFMQPDNILTVDIRDEGEHLIVSNNKHLRKQIETSNKLGLRQLKELYAYLTKLPVVIKDERERFEVKLPLL